MVRGLDALYKDLKRIKAAIPAFILFYKYYKAINNSIGPS